VVAGGDVRVAALARDRRAADDRGNERKGPVMSEWIERQKPVIERSGLGLLPGITLALALSIGLIAAILIETWWVIAVVLVGIFGVTGVVVAVITGLLGGDDDIYSDRAR
jgi:hypothetical protein